MSAAAEHFPVLWPVTSEACSIEKPASNRRLVPEVVKVKVLDIEITALRRNAVPTDFPL
jgi:hypothetical protein